MLTYSPLNEACVATGWSWGEGGSLICDTKHTHTHTFSQFLVGSVYYYPSFMVFALYLFDIFCEICVIIWVVIEALLSFYHSDVNENWSRKDNGKIAQPEIQPNV